MVVILLLTVLAMVNIKIGPVIRDMASYQAKLLAARAINEAVDQVLTEQQIGYDQLAVVSRNETGDVTAIESNMLQINGLNTEITQHILERLTLMGKDKVSLPLGTLLGGQFLAGRGPDVEFLIIPTGFAKTNVTNRFSEAGINQTRHQIMMSVEIGILAVLPVYSSETTFSTSICLAETVIVGAVPDNFTRIETSGENAIPNLVADYGTGRSPYGISGSSAGEP